MNMFIHKVECPHLVDDFEHIYEFIYPCRLACPFPQLKHHPSFLKWFGWASRSFKDFGKFFSSVLQTLALFLNVLEFSSNIISSSLAVALNLIWCFWSLIHHTVRLLVNSCFLLTMDSSDFLCVQYGITIEYWSSRDASRSKNSGKNS